MRRIALNARVGDVEIPMGTEILPITVDELLATVPGAGMEWVRQLPETHGGFAGKVQGMCLWIFPGDWYEDPP